MLYACYTDLKLFIGRKIDVALLFPALPAEAQYRIAAGIPWATAGFPWGSMQ